MKVAALQEIKEIDMSIQGLLGELSELYATRTKLMDGTAGKSSTVRRSRSKKTSQLDDVDFYSFDLSLHD